MGWFDKFRTPAHAPEGSDSPSGKDEPLQEPETGPTPPAEPRPEPPPTPEGGDTPTMSEATHSLDVIVNGILKALSDAQTSADSMAHRLLSSPDFPGGKVPNPVIDRVDFQLCFAVVKHALKETSAISTAYTLDPASLRDAAKRAAREVAQQAASHFVPADPPAGMDAKELENRREIAANLNARPSIRWLAEDIQNALRQHKAQWLDSRTGAVDTAKVAALMDEAARAALAGHPEIPQHWLSVSEAEGGPGVLGFSLDSAAEGLHGTAIQVPPPPPKSQFDVVIDAGELARLPPQAVQTLKLSVVMHELSAPAAADDTKPQPLKD